LPTVHTAEQDAETKAFDSTATQRPFQSAYPIMPEHKDDLLNNGQPRPGGANYYLQLRIVAPLPFDNSTILPRLTVRHYENAQGQPGIGNTELISLIIPKGWNWGSGRTGRGPLVTAPGNENLACDE
jgi:hypothetical protein